MIATETSLWALVKMSEYNVDSVIVGADYQALWDMSDPVTDYILPVSIDWPSLDAEEVVPCARSGV